MIKFYSKLFNVMQCAYLRNEILKKVAEDSISYERGALTSKSKGHGNLPVSLTHVPYLTKVLSTDLGNIEFVNSYSRVYYNGSELLPHIDREPLEITLSVCVHSSNIEWPLWVCSEEISRISSGVVANNKHLYIANSTPYVTKIGEGVVCLGNKNPHWREKLECHDTEKVAQIFYHWKFK